MQPGNYGCKQSEFRPGSEGNSQVGYNRSVLCMRTTQLSEISLTIPSFSGSTNVPHWHSFAQGRNGKGSIYVWAAGNGGWSHDSCAADGYSASIYTISVGSADQTGGQAAYDENCPAKMAVTFSYNSDTFPGPGDTWDPYKQVVSEHNKYASKQFYKKEQLDILQSTTTLNGQCTDDFTGTSASTPLLSGTIALVLQAK